MRVSIWFIVGLGCLFLFGFFVLGVSLYRLQTEMAGEFAEVETTQTTRRISVPALRDGSSTARDMCWQTAARAAASSATLRNFSNAAVNRIPSMPSTRRWKLSPPPSACPGP